MMHSNLEQLTTVELIDEFTNAARQRGGAVLDSETRRANRMYDRMKAVDDILRHRGLQARLSLQHLLEDKDRFVRYYAAIYLLGLMPDRARPVIEENAKYWVDALSSDARGLLREFDEGKYKPD